MTPGATWTLVVPVKRLDQAKSRLDLPAPVRAALALAMARDTLDAVLGAASVARVVVVTGEPAIRAALAGHPRVHVLADPGTGLTAAIAHGVQHLLETRAGGSGVLLGDLPALRSNDLDATLARAGGRRRAVVPDADGTGTTLLTAGGAADLRPRFGPGSRAAHEAAGHRVVDAALGLRQDVDTTADLAAASLLGVGPATARALADLNAGSGAPTAASEHRAVTAG